VHRYFAGVIWWVLEPILQMSVYYVVFGILMKHGQGDFVTFLLVGLLSWRWTSKSITDGMNSILGGRGLMTQVHVPKLVFPTVIILTQTFKFALVMVVLLVYLWVSGYPPNLAYLELPLLLIVQLLFNAACGYAVAAVMPFLPDLKYLVISFVTLALFVSGVFFDGKRLDPEHQQWFFYNPAAKLLDELRGILMHGNYVDLRAMALIAVGASVLIALTAWLVHRYDHRYVKIVR